MSRHEVERMSLPVTFMLSITLIFCLHASPVSSGVTGAHCGRKAATFRAMDSLIVGGNNARVGAWPWQVRLETLSETGYGHCGGVIVDKRWILTAAHCLRETDPSKQTVLFGINKRTGVKAANKETVEKVYVHHGFLATNKTEDIALLYLTKDLPFSRTVQPACLPTKLRPPGTLCAVTGFGRTTSKVSDSKGVILQEVFVPLVDQEVCAAWMKPKLLVSDGMLCAGYEAGGKDACEGDSGGPLVCEERGVWEVQGIVSLGSTVCATAHTAGIYTKVLNYIDWIRDIMNKH